MLADLVFINGTFDLLHPGHIQLFQVALGFNLPIYVSITSDKLVSAHKNRLPIFSETHRADLVQAIVPEARVCIHDSEQCLLGTIRNLCNRHVVLHIKGSDYVGKEIVGREYFKHILFLERSEHSSTELYEKSYSAR